MGKSIHELKAEIMYLCVWDREKINRFEIAVIISKTYKKCKSPFQKGFLKVQNLKMRHENVNGKK